MNQTNPHFTQWKNVPDEQKAEHDFENYAYEYQDGIGWQPFDYKNYHFVHDEPIVYRLVVEPDKYYFLEESDGVTSYVIKGSEISPISAWPILRPATPDEIPEPELPKQVQVDGYEHTDVHREPLEGEWYYSDALGEMCQGDGIPFDGPSWIMEKTEPTLEQRIARKYSHMDVVMIAPVSGAYRLIEQGVQPYHTDAQARIGFYKYAYNFLGEIKLNSLPTSTRADVTIHPVAVLFYRDAAQG